MHGADAFGLVDIVAADFLGRQHARFVAKHFVLNFGFTGDLLEHALAMREIEVTAALRLAIYIAGLDQIFESLKAILDFSMQLQCDLAAPARNPLRARQTTG